MSSGEETIRFSVSLPASLLEELDGRVTAKGYASRSELVRDLIRERIVADLWAGGEEEVIGVLTISYDHHRHELAQKLVDLQHGHYVNILCSTHVHLDHDTCVEAIFLQGRPREIEKICIEIGGLRGVKLAGLTRTSKIAL